MILLLVQEKLNLEMSFESVIFVLSKHFNIEVKEEELKEVLEELQVEEAERISGYNQVKELEDF